MGFLGQEFNEADMPESDSFEPIPAGWYMAKVAAAELKDTKAGNGRYIKLRFDIVGPSHQGRVVFANINISNPNPTAEEIGRKQLGDLMRSTGLAKLSDTDQLVGGNCSIKVSISKSDQYGDSNDVKAYKAIEGSAPPKPAAKQGVELADTITGSTPPW